MTAHDSKNFSQTFESPSNIQDFLSSGWRDRIYSRIRRFVLYDVCNQEEDLYQEIILSLIQTDYLNRYDPIKGPFESFIYIFVDNFLKRKFARENTKNGKKIVTRASLEISSPSEEAEFEPGVIYLETLLEVSDSSKDVDFNVALESLRKRLALKYKASSSVEYNGYIINRDPETVLKLLSADLTIAEIADIFNTSKQFVYSLVKKIRELAPEYFEYSSSKIK